MKTITVFNRVVLAVAMIAAAPVVWAQAAADAGEVLRLLDPRLPGWGFPRWGSALAAGLDAHRASRFFHRRQRGRHPSRHRQEGGRGRGPGYDSGHARVAYSTAFH